MRDGRIPTAWRVDLPNRCVELWKPVDPSEPIAILVGGEQFSFAAVTFTVDEVFQTVLNR